MYESPFKSFMRYLVLLDLRQNIYIEKKNYINGWVVNLKIKTNITRKSVESFANAMRILLNAPSFYVYPLLFTAINRRKNKSK